MLKLMYITNVPEIASSGTARRSARKIGTP